MLPSALRISVLMRRHVRKGCAIIFVRREVMASFAADAPCAYCSELRNMEIARRIPKKHSITPRGAKQPLRRKLFSKLLTLTVLFLSLLTILDAMILPIRLEYGLTTEGTRLPVQLEWRQRLMRRGGSQGAICPETVCLQGNTFQYYSLLHQSFLFISCHC